MRNQRDTSNGTFLDVFHIYDTAMLKSWVQRVGGWLTSRGIVRRFYAGLVVNSTAHVNKASSLYQFYQQFVRIVSHGNLRYFMSVTGQFLPIIHSTYNNDNKLFTYILSITIRRPV